MPSILLFRLVVIVLVYNGAPSSTLHTSDTSFVPPPTHAVTSPITTSKSRDTTSLIITQCLGLPPLYLHPTIPLSAHYALNLFYHVQKSAPFILCPQHMRRPVLIAFSRTLILLLLCSSGDVEVNPGPVCPQVLSFVEPKSLGFIHVNIRSLLPKFVLLTALAHSANPDVLSMSESWFRKATKNPEISIPNYNIFIKIELPKGQELQYTAEIACTVAACYRPPSGPSCALVTICEWIASHLSSEFVLLGDLNWDMLNTPAVLQSKLDALNLTQIIKEPTRYNRNL